MQKHFLKFGKVFTSVACTPLILISNNSELAAKYLPNDFEQKIITSEINNENNSLFQGLYTNQNKNFFIAENNDNIEKESVLISEIIIEGWQNHPEGRKLESVSYTHLTLPTTVIV